jgi:ABC-2 type transport system permease protein
VSGLLLPRGSTVWLLAHELRLSLRNIGARRGARTTWIILGGVAVLLVVTAGLPLAMAMRHATVEATPLLVMAFDLAIVAIFTLMLSQTLAAATMAFYVRGDLDLLLSSPLPPSRVLAARAIAIAVTPLLWFAAIASLAILPMAVVGQPRWTAIYGVLVAIALLAATVGISLAMALFRLIGPRATRTVGQLLAAFIGASFFLAAQARNFLPDNGRQLYGGVMAWSQGGVFAADGAMSWPARAVLGEPLPLLSIVLGSLILFTLVTRGLGRRFAADASVAAGIGSGPKRGKASAATDGSFGGGVFGNVLRKELRLLVRDPTLLSQVLLRALYVLPLAFVMLKTAGQSSGDQPSAIDAWRLAVLAGGVALMAGQVASSLAWITISAEDAPELLTCAPVDGGLVRRAKLSAAMIPVVALLAAPLGVLIWLSPFIGVVASLGALGSAASAGMINLWFEKATPRTAFRNRRNGSVLAGIAEVLVGMSWGLTTGVAATGSVFAVIPAAFTVAAMALLYGLSSTQRSERSRAN